MIENNSRSPMEECDEDPFWEDLLDKYPIIEDAISILPWVEKAVEYILEEGHKRGVIQEKDDRAAEAEYAAWLRHKEGVEDRELDIQKFSRRMERISTNGTPSLKEESPSEEHVRQQEWRDKYWEEWMNEWKEDHPNKEEK